MRGAPGEIAEAGVAEARLELRYGERDGIGDLSGALSIAIGERIGGEMEQRARSPRAKLRP